MTQISANSIELFVAAYSSFAPRALTFSQGELVNITVLDDLVPINTGAVYEQVHYRFVVDSFQFLPTEGKLDVNFRFSNAKHVLNETLEVGSLHLLVLSKNNISEHPSLVLQLVSFDTYIFNGVTAFHMVFRSADQIMDLEAELRPILETGGVVMLPLMHLKAPILRENEVTVGYAIDSITNRMSYQLTNTGLAGVISPYYGSTGNGFISYGIEKIQLGQRSFKNEYAAYKPYAPDTVVIDTEGVDDAIYSVSRQSITCVFKGIPLKVEAAMSIDSNIVEFTLSTSMFHDYMSTVASFVGGYILWIDNTKQAYILGCNKLARLEGSNMYSMVVSVLSVFGSPMAQDYFINELGRCVHVLPFKVFTHVRVADINHQVHVPRNLSVGMYNGKETLSVNGNVSMKNERLMYNNGDERDPSNLFRIRFTNPGVFSLNNSLEITGSNVKIERSLEVGGTITAADFAQFSDQRLKYNIRDTSASDDLQRLMQVRVKEFKLLAATDENRQNKGVIAQEVRDVFPEAISTTRSVLPGFFEHVAFVERDKMRLRLHQSAQDVQNIKAGDVIRVTSLDTRGGQIDLCVSNVERINVDENEEVMYIYVGNVIGLDTFVKIIGVVDDVLLVNYEILYMTAINAIQELKREIEALKVLVAGA